MQGNHRTDSKDTFVNKFYDKDEPSPEDLGLGDVAVQDVCVRDAPEGDNDAIDDEVKGHPTYGATDADLDDFEEDRGAEADRQTANTYL